MSLQTIEIRPSSETELTNPDEIAKVLEENGTFIMPMSQYRKVLVDYVKVSALYRLTLDRLAKARGDSKTTITFGERAAILKENASLRDRLSKSKQFNQARQRRTKELEAELANVKEALTATRGVAAGAVESIRTNPLGVTYRELKKKHEELLAVVQKFVGEVRP